MLIGHKITVNKRMIAHDFAHRHDELQELCNSLGGDDFCANLDGREYRFIHDAEIENIYAESIRDLFEDCYNLDDIPHVLRCHINWDGVVQDCMVEGYGHHFSGYDGSEEEITGYYIFRTN